MAGRDGASAGARRADDRHSVARTGERQGRAHIGGDEEALRAGRAELERNDPAHTLPIGKLMGIPRHSKLGLKAHGVTTCGQLLALADSPDRQAVLARASGIELDELQMVIDRADMARVNGIGWMFGLMLENLGIRTVAVLAMQEPDDLHRRLADQNRERRLARRSPTLEEVTRWIAQARDLWSGPAH